MSGATPMRPLSATSVHNNSTTLSDDSIGALNATSATSIGSPSSPACGMVYARNTVTSYIDEVRSLVHRLHEYDNRGLPPLYPTAIDEILDSYEAYVCKDSDDTSELEVRMAFERLQEDMSAQGVTLYLEVLRKDARDAYLDRLESFLQWLHTTQHKTGAEQPLTESERLIMTDFAQTERRWAERDENIICSKSVFEDRARMIRELRNADAEERRQDERIRVLIRDDDGLGARRRQMFKHVGNRAAMLRNTPKDNLSMKQRRDCKTIATNVMAWIDEHFADGSIDELADKLQMVCETAQETSAAADLVARNNELSALLDFIRSSVGVQKDVKDTLGPDRCEALAFIVAKAEHWLDVHPQPTIQTLEKFVESLRSACQKYGLSPPSPDAPVSGSLPSGPGSVDPASTAATSSAAVAPSSAVPEKLLKMVTVACAMLEEVMLLRVACAAGGAASFIARRIAPLQLELEAVVDDALALEDGAAPLIKRYRDMLQACKAECPSVAIPTSCFTHILPFEDVELED